MRCIRMIGLLIVAAGSMIAIPLNASAATLTSPAGTEYTGELQLSATETQIFKESVYSSTCTGSEINGTIATNTTQAVESVAKLAFTGCDSLYKTLASGELEVKSSGEVFLKGNEWTSEKIGVSCIYGGGTGTKIGTLTAGTTASLPIAASLPKQLGSGSLCAANGAWSGKYKVTTPDTLLVDAPSPVATLTSPSGTEYTGEFKMTATETLTLKASVATFTCTGSEVAGKVETNDEAAASGKIGTLSLSGCDSIVKTLKNGSLEANSKGEVFLKENEVTTEKVGVSCIYGGGAGTKIGTLTGGTTATLAVSASLPKQAGSGSLCAANASWTGKYKFTTPDTLLVA